MSMYADYLQEFSGDNILETEEGFVTWRYVNLTTVYLVDIYVKPEFRFQDVASKFSEHVVNEAKKEACSEMMGTVYCQAKNPDQSIKVLMAHGMKVKSANNDVIVFVKRI